MTVKMVLCVANIIYSMIDKLYKTFLDLFAGKGISTSLSMRRNYASSWIRFGFERKPRSTASSRARARCTNERTGEV